MEKIVLWLFELPFKLVDMVKSIMLIAFLALAVTYIYQQPIVNEKLAPYVAPVFQKVKMLGNKINDLITFREEDEDSTAVPVRTAIASSHQIAAELGDAATQVSEALATTKVMSAEEDHFAKMKGSFGKAKDDFLAFCHAYYIIHIFFGLVVFISIILVSYLIYLIKRKE